MARKESNWSGTSDVDLAVLARADHEALEKLERRWGKWRDGEVARLARRVKLADQEVADARQAVALAMQLAVQKKFDPARFNCEGGLQPFLAKVVATRFADFVRSFRRAHAVAWVALLDDVIALHRDAAWQRLAGEEDPLQLLLTREERAALAKGLKQLDGQDRKIWGLRLAGLSRGLIVKKLAITPAQLRKAETHLKKKLLELLPPPQET